MIREVWPSALPKDTWRTTPSTVPTNPRLSPFIHTHTKLQVFYSTKHAAPSENMNTAISTWGRRESRAVLTVPCIFVPDGGCSGGNSTFSCGSIKAESCVDVYHLFMTGTASDQTDGGGCCSSSLCTSAPHWSSLVNNSNSSKSRVEKLLQIHITGSTSVLQNELWLFIFFNFY